MTTLLILLLVGQIPPGPLDGFRANFASIRADVDYNYEFGTADRITAEGGRLWRGEIVGFVETRARARNGHWSYDGAVERYEERAPDDVLQEARRTRGTGDTTPSIVEPFEMIFDGEKSAFHRIKGESIDPRSHNLIFQRNREPGLLGNSGAPFYWWGKSRFPIVIEGEFKDARRERDRSLVNGFRTEVETYTQNTSDVRSLEVHFDPSIGYLPRYARVCGPIDQTKHAVKEMYMLDARPCGAGGFVPFEWYWVGYYVDDFIRRYPDYGYKSVLRPSYHRIAIGHYKAVRMSDRKKPVTLEKLAGITRISTTEGRVALGTVPARMRLDEVEARLRKVFAHPKPPLPAVDIDEIRRFSRAPERNPGWYVILGTCLLLPLFVIGFFVMRHRRVLLLLIALLMICSGCAERASGLDPSITAEVAPSLVIYEPNTPLLNLTLSLTNRSNQIVKLFQASGGCICRKIDQRSLPRDLGPGQSVALPITLSGDRSYEPSGFNLALLTDLGPREFLVKYVAFPRHRISPESINLGMLADGHEEKEASFELVHREVFEGEKPRTESSLKVPPQFSFVSTGSHVTELLENPKLAYVDKSYHLTLRDKSYGLTKASVQLSGHSGGGLVEAAIVWQRVPYLSSIPQRVYLGTRPIRVFLHCPDETVELTRTLFAPPGIKAVVSSAREVTVMVERGAPETIDGAIEVGTTATDRPPLRISVSRYAPLASGNSEGR